MGAPIMRPEYVDEAFLNEVREFGGVLYFSHAANALGFDDPWNLQQRDAFLHYRHPVTGERLLRWQANSPDWLYGLIPSVTASVNLWSNTLGKDALEQFLREDLRQANNLYLAVIDSRIGVRATIDGEKKNMMAKMPWMSGIHVLNRHGEKSVHVHNIGLRGGVTLGDNQLYSLADRREIVRAIKDATEVFHASIAQSMEMSGVRTELVDGKCEVVAFKEAAMKQGGTRREEMKAYLRAKGIKPTGPAMAFAAQNARPREKKEFDAGERLRYWQEKAATVTPTPVLPPEQPSKLASYLKALVDEFVVMPARVIGLAIKKSYGPKHQTVKVRDGAAFLFDTAPKTRRDGHRGALRALRRTNLRGLTHALKVAEAGYRQGRKPFLELPPGTRVVLSKQAVEAMTPKQLDELRARAADNRWVLRLPGVGLDHGMSMGR